MFDNIFARIIIAVIIAVILFALLPPVFRLIGYPLTGDLLLVIRLCIAGLLALWIWRGGPAIT